MSIEFSIVICTYNREEILPVALASACEQNFERDSYEILVIDNNSTDGTAAIVQKFSERFSNVRYQLEREIGLSHARNCGWRSANGFYIAYIDDDCKLPPEWLGVARCIVERHSPAAFGGPIFPFFNAPKPMWFKESYGTVQHEHGSSAASNQLHGNNMFIRRDLLEDLQGFDTDLGMKGGKIAYGEETRFFDHLVEKYPEELLYYDPHLFLYHLVRSEKMTLPWLLRAFFAKGRYSYLTLHANIVSEFGTASLVLNGSKMMTRIVYDLTIAALLRDRRKYPFAKNYLYEHTSHYLKSLGRLYAKHEIRRLQEGKRMQRA